jgi:hypothetical protein
VRPDRHRRRLVVALGCLVAAVSLATTARAVFTPAWSYLPPALRTRLAQQLGGSLFLPARTPLFYRYRDGASVSNGVLSVTFTNRVRIHKGLWRWTKQTLLWQARKLPTGASCEEWASWEQTFQVSGNKVFGGTDDSGTPVSWRCVTNKRGTYVLSAEGNRFETLGLAFVVATGLDVSRRR